MKMFSKIKSWWFHFKQSYKAFPREDIVMAKTYEVQECTRDAATKKRVQKQFDEQEQSMNARALKPHACPDPLSCVKRVCFKRTPDKIVSSPYQVGKRGKRIDVESEDK